LRRSLGRASSDAPPSRRLHPTMSRPRRAMRPSSWLAKRCGPCPLLTYLISSINLSFPCLKFPQDMVLFVPYSLLSKSDTVLQTTCQCGPKCIVDVPLPSLPLPSPPSIASGSLARRRLILLPIHIPSPLNSTLAATMMMQRATSGATRTAALQKLRRVARAPSIFGAPCCCERLPNGGLSQGQWFYEERRSCCKPEHGAASRVAAFLRKYGTGAVTSG
jgi:hypothetical protein